MTQLPSLIAGLDQPANVLVIGASGSIGAALVAHLLAHPAVGFITAAARHAEQSPNLVEMRAHQEHRLALADGDITCSDSLQALAVRMHHAPLHLTINGTGLLHADRLLPEKSLAAIDHANLQQIFAVNAFGPILLARAVLPLMRHGSPAVFASLSARVGSIGDNQLGGWYSYRAAKAAQNQLMKTLSIECRRSHPQLSVQIMHPGTVDSALSRPFQRGVAAEKIFTPARAAAQLLDLIASSTPDNSGRFVAWDGSAIPW